MFEISIGLERLPSGLMVVVVTDEALMVECLPLGPRS